VAMCATISLQHDQMSDARRTTQSVDFGVQNLFGLGEIGVYAADV
jgi:hypothetical protein